VSAEDMEKTFSSAFALLRLGGLPILSNHDHINNNNNSSKKDWWSIRRHVRIKRIISIWSGFVYLSLTTLTISLYLSLYHLATHRPETQEKRKEIVSLVSEVSVFTCTWFIHGYTLHKIKPLDNHIKSLSHLSKTFTEKFGKISQPPIRAYVGFILFYSCLKTFMTSVHIARNPTQHLNLYHGYIDWDATESGARVPFALIRLLAVFHEIIKMWDT